MESLKAIEVVWRNYFPI